MAEADVQGEGCLLGEHQCHPCRAFAPTSPAAGFTSPRRAYQPRSDPHNPAPPRREACESRSASLFLPEPPDAPAQLESFWRGASLGAFGKPPAGLAGLT